MNSENDTFDFSYNDDLQVFEGLIPHLVLVSDSSGGINTSTIGIEGTKIYTRLVLSAMTINSILPNNRVNHSKLWDFSSVATLSRSLIETTHRYLYLTERGISAEEAEFRRKLHFYRINCEKNRLYSEMEDLEILDAFKKKLPEDKAEIMASSIYLSLDKYMAKKVRAGNTDMHLTDEDVAKTNNLIKGHFGFYYRLLSNHAHSSPMATTSQSNIRGRGTENVAENFYLSLSLKLLSRYLSKSLLSQVSLLSLESSCKKSVSQARLVFSKEEI